MLFCSSIRALSSISAVTCLPFCAARASAEMMGLAPLVRYSVCLMARTCGSSAARSMKSTTHPNDSYGRWTSTSCERMTSNTSRPCAKGGATRGTSGSSLKAGNPSSRCKVMSAIRSIGPGRRYTSRASRSCAPVSISTKASSASAEISRRTGSLRRRCRRLSSIISRRSSASSSSIVRSVFRVTRNTVWLTTRSPPNSSPRWRAMMSSSRTKRTRPSPWVDTITTRSSSAGTWTTAKWRPDFCPPFRRLTTRAMLRLLLWTCGNGCPGSMASGVRTGAMLARNKVSTCRRSASVKSSSRTRSTPPPARPGRTSSSRMRYCSATSSWARRSMAASCSAGAMPSAP